MVGKDKEMVEVSSGEKGPNQVPEGSTEVEARKKLPEGKVETRRTCCGQIRKVERMI